MHTASLVNTQFHSYLAAATYCPTISFTDRLTTVCLSLDREPASAHRAPSNPPPSSHPHPMFSNDLFFFVTDVIVECLCFQQSLTLERSLWN